MAKRINIIANSGTAGASTYRIRLWEKGLLEEGINVKVHFLVKKVQSKALMKIQFIYHLIKIYFLSSSDIIWIYGYVPEIVYKLLRKKIDLIERNEYPYHLIKENYHKIQDLAYYYKNVTKFISCSNALINYYSQFTGAKCRFIKSSLLVDYHEFAIISKENPLKGTRYIAYCGYMGSNKDGLYDLLNAFSLFCEKVKDIKLCLIGRADGDEMRKIEDHAKQLGIDSRVIFPGYVNHDDIPAYLQNAEVLLLARPDNKQAEGGFPSKLGEYLSTGRPVLVTAVGEIANYIIDNESGFIVIPDDPAVFASKLDYIFKNKEQAEQVGLNGQLLAKDEFDYRHQTRELIKFFELQNYSLIDNQ